MKRRDTLRLTILLIISSVIHVQAQHNNVYFRHLTRKDGLSSNNVSAITEDQYGFMWASTREGVYRYDGSSFRLMFPQEKHHVLVRDVSIEGILFDCQGLLWIGTSKGLFCYSPEMDTLSKYPVSKGSRRNLLEVMCRPVLQMSDGRLFITYRSNVGFTLLDTKSSKAAHFTRDANKEATALFPKWNERSTKFFIDQKGRCFLFLPGDYLHILEGNAIKKTAISIPAECTAFALDSLNRLIFGKYSVLIASLDSLHLPARPIGFPIEANDIQSLGVDASNRLWKASLTSSQVYDLNKGKLLREIPYKGNFSQSDIVASKILLTSDGSWIQWTSQEISFTGYKNLKTIFFSNDPTNPNSLGYDKRGMYLWSGSQGTLFIATYQIGIQMFDLSISKFPSICTKPGDPNSIRGTSIAGVYAHGRRFVWIGNENGLHLYDRHTDKFHHYPIASSLVSAIYTPDNHNIYIGDIIFRHYQFDSLNMSLRKVHDYYPGDDTTSLTTWYIPQIEADRKGAIWLSTGNGIALFVPPTEKKSPGHFRRFAYDANSGIGVPGKITWDFMHDTYGDLWLATNAGLSRLDTETSEFTTYKASEQPGSMPSNNPKCVFEDRKRRIWVGTEGSGLCLFDRKTEAFRTYTKTSGLPSNTIYGIGEGPAGVLWLATADGLCRFDPDSMKVFSFGMADGIPSDDFPVEPASFNPVTGEILFATRNGVVIFHPDSISLTNRKPRLYITNFHIYNQEVPVGYWKGKRQVLSKSIFLTDSITLHHTDKNLTFSFACLDYSAPEKIRYKYRMEGVDNEWIYTDNKRNSATYTNMQPGSYILRIQATNSDGIWNANERCLYIRVRPPWWQTWWFRILTSILVVFFVFAFVRLRLSILKRQKKELEKLIQLRTDEIMRQNQELQFAYQELQEKQTEILAQNEHIRQQKSVLENANREMKLLSEQLHEADQMKIRFFMNVSHEFRTPLTLILGPLESILGNREYNNLDEKLNLIYRNSKRLLRLINQLLDLRKIESGNMMLTVAEKDIIGFVRQVFQSFQYLAQRHSIVYQFHANEAQGFSIGFFDSDKLEKILYNLISNAFKYTPDGGKISMIVSIHHLLLTIVVEDTGIGIAPDKLPRIFDRFYRVENPQEHKSSGTGIGLALTKELINLHKGNIEVESVPGKGSRFIITLPVAASAYDENERFVIEDDTGFDKYPHITNSVIAEEPVLTVLPNGEKNEKPQVLLVEDNADMRLYIKQLLESHYEVSEAENGKTGVSAAIETVPDLVISDVMMPEINGFELCSMLKQDERTSHIPIILLTAKTKEDDILAGLQTGADDYIGKPFNARILLQKCHNLIRNREKLRQSILKTDVAKSTSLAPNRLDNAFLEKLVEAVNKHIETSEFNVEQLAVEVGVSRTQLYRKLNALTGLSVNDFINKVKLEKAREMLASGSYTIAEAAYAIGFNQPSSFSRSFKKYFGQTPSEFLNQ